MTIMTPPPLDQEDNEMLVPHFDLADGVQPMVTSAKAPALPASAADTQAAPEESPPISRLHPRKRYSEVFSVGGYKWRVLVTVFPKGNKAGHLSMYLDVADSGNLPYGWS